VVPGCTLAELTALEAILTALAQQGSLSTPVLVHLLVQDICHYYTKLREHQQVERERRCHVSAAAAATDSTADMDVDAPAEASAEGDAAAALTRADFVEQLRHVFALLLLLSAAQPSVIKAKYVPVLLEVGFSPDLAVGAPLVDPCRQSLSEHLSPPQCSTAESVTRISTRLLKLSLPTP